MNLLSNIIKTKTILELSREVVKYVDRQKVNNPELEDKNFIIGYDIDMSNFTSCWHVAYIEVKI